VNLIVNAVQAMASTGTHGRLGVRSCVDGSDVVIAISDTGGGIPDAIRDRVFDPFFTTKPVGEGTGQGLAISRAIVDRHGGKLDFESDAGRGTTFHVRVPIAGPAKRLAA
jgi:signal transduction histidine kinase